MKKFAFCLAALAAVSVVAAVWAGEDNTEPQLRLAVDLVDGSRIIGIPRIESVPVQTTYARIDLPLKQIRTMTMGDDHETASFALQNGDTLKGVVSLGPIKLETLFGRVSIGVEHVRELRVARSGAALPAGEGTLSFGGVNWMPWRTGFEVQGDKLVSLPKARPGFSYGHWGHGRGATLVSNVGSAAWKDYSLEFEFCMRGVNPAFNLHGLPLDYRAGSILFHVADTKESWNERGSSSYAFGIGADGTWSVVCSYNVYSRTPSGWHDIHSEGSRTLAKGTGLKTDPRAGNRFRIDVCGTRIQVWMDDVQLVDVRDEQMGETLGGQTLDHGGIGIQAAWECMIWIRNFSVRPL